MLEKHEMVEKLQNGVVTVIFEKVDGTERTMKATLLAEYLPVEEKSDVPARAKSEHSIAVWDVEKNGWRSFRPDSVKEFLVE